MSWYKPWSWFDEDQPEYGQQGNPSNYNSGADPNGFGGPGQVFGGGMVPLGGLNLPYFQQDRDRITGQLSGQSPFAGSEWGALISQLQARSSGTGPSIAGDAYQQASQDAMNNLTSLSQGSASPSAARQAILQQGHIQQGMSQGYARARNEEAAGATGQLGQVLGARDQINQNAYTNLLSQLQALSEGQLKAGIANQQYDLGVRGAQGQEKAAKLQALSTFLAGLAKLGATGG